MVKIFLCRSLRCLLNSRYGIIVTNTFKQSCYIIVHISYILWSDIYVRDYFTKLSGKENNILEDEIPANEINGVMIVHECVSNFFLSA